MIQLDNLLNRYRYHLLLIAFLLCLGLLGKAYRESKKQETENRPVFEPIETIEQRWDPEVSAPALPAIEQQRTEERPAAKEIRTPDDLPPLLPAPPPTLPLGETVKHARTNNNHPDVD